MNPSCLVATIQAACRVMVWGSIFLVHFGTNSALLSTSFAVSHVAPYMTTAYSSSNASFHVSGALCVDERKGTKRRTHGEG